MKKLIYFFALLGIVSMASCSGKSNNASTTEVVMVTDSLVPDTATIAVYEGILPGADVAGIQYVLELGQTANGDSVYQLSMTYLGANKGKDTTFIQEGCLLKNGSTASPVLHPISVITVCGFMNRSPSSYTKLLKMCIRDRI